jgi:Tol biopolymer transport system component
MQNADLYLLEVATGNIERETTNKGIAESAISYSPDGRYIAFAAPDDFTFMHNQRVYLRDRSARGGSFR